MHGTIAAAVRPTANQNAVPYAAALASTESTPRDERSSY